MSSYESIDYFLSNYMDVNIGYSEEEFIEELKEELLDKEFRTSIKIDLKNASLDKDFSWKTVFEEFNVRGFDSDEVATDYAKKMLYELVFPG